jgi:hypothetical protein
VKDKDVMEARIADDVDCAKDFPPPSSPSSPGVLAVDMLIVYVGNKKPGKPPRTGHFGLFTQWAEPEANTCIKPREN